MLEAATVHAAGRLIEALDALKYVGIDGHAVPDWKARSMAADALFDRLYGKPAQAITGENGAAISFGVVLLPADDPSK